MTTLLRDLATLAPNRLGSPTIPSKSSPARPNKPNCSSGRSICTTSIPGMCSQCRARQDNPYLLGVARISTPRRSEEPVGRRYVSPRSRVNPVRATNDAPNSRRWDRSEFKVSPARTLPHRDSPRHMQRSANPVWLFRSHMTRAARFERCFDRCPDAQHVLLRVPLAAQEQGRPWDRIAPCAAYGTSLRSPRNCCESV